MTPLAGPVSFNKSLFGGGKKFDIFGFWHPRPAAWPTKNAGCLYPKEKHALKADIALDDRFMHNVMGWKSGFAHHFSRLS